ncbi:hypothetical protein AX16_002604 [Volvariella volvacea WC 439]|nr:hypothetical protein AX16_002604 [Volvariella volvacea WC 439]
MSLASRSMAFSATSAGSNDEGSTFPLRRRNNRSMTSQSLLRPIPEWWKVDYNQHRLWPIFAQLEALIFQLMCVIAFGKTELYSLWEDTLPGNEEYFKETKESLTHQVNNTNIISGLILATSAVFLTTGSPREDMLQFDNAGPYVCLLASFGLAMGSMICGSALQLIAGRCTPRWLRQNLASTRIRLIFTLGLIGYPLLSVAMSGTLCGIGLLIAAMSSAHDFIKAGAIVVISIPYTLFLVFLWLALTPGHDEIGQELNRESIAKGSERMTKEATDTTVIDALEKGQA